MATTRVEKLVEDLKMILEGEEGHGLTVSDDLKKRVEKVALALGARQCTFSCIQSTESYSGIIVEVIWSDAEEPERVYATIDH